MELILKAKHFKYTRFEKPCNCAIAKAAKEVFDTKDVKEFMNYVVVNGKALNHRLYLSEHFWQDKEKAKQLGYSDAPIRTIHLR